MATRIFHTGLISLFFLFLIGTVSENILADDGQSLYEARCAGCHEGGAPKAPHREMLLLLTRGTIVKALTEGVMQEQADGLSPDQITSIANYISQIEVSASGGLPPVCPANKKWRADYTAGFTGWALDQDSRHYIPDATAGFSLDDLANFELKWAFSYPDANRARSQPTIAGGSVFVGSHDGNIYALDAQTGCLDWTFAASAEVRTAISHMTLDGGDYLYFGDLIGHVYLLDARTGALVWRVKVDDHPSATITAAPGYYNGVLYVPVSSLEVTPAADPNYPCCTFRGKVVALDALTGGEIWRAFTIDEEPVEHSETLVGTPVIGPSGAPIWAGLLIDAERQLVIAGTGENYSSPPTGTSDAIIAFDMKTGQKRWVFQATENDAWNVACMMEDKTNCPVENGPDFDFGSGAIMYQNPNGPDLVLAGQKSGVVHAINADTGVLVWQRKVGQGGIQGGIHFGMALKGDRLYVPMSDFDDGEVREFPRQPGMSAINITTGEIIWQNVHEDACDGRAFCSPGISAAVTAFDAGVLGGGMDGMLRAYDQNTGKVNWQIDTTKTIVATNGVEVHGGSMGGASAPIAYNGLLYVNSGYGIYNHMPGNVLLVFGPKKN